MIYITGDTHCPIDVHKLSKENFDDTELTKEDYLIICGDVGLVWYNRQKADEWWQKWFNKKNYTLLFVDGNHENHDALDAMEVHEWKGGKVHYLKDSVIHLMRGQVFDIDGTKIFTMGGAMSVDIAYRTLGISWWTRELPSKEEYEEARHNLKKHSWKVDYVITHSAPYRIHMEMFPYSKSNSLLEFLNDIESQLDYKQWYFGHYHDDKQIDDKHRLIYENIIKIK